MATMDMPVNNIELDLKIGDRFKSFEEVENRIKEVTTSKFLQYYRRDSRTISSARNKTKRYLNPELYFYQVKYTCVHGGRQYVRKGKGLRNRT